MLTTERLVLRGALPKDIDPMFAAYSDPEAMRFWSTEPHADKSVTQALLERRITHWKHTKTNFQLTLDGEYIGNAGNFFENEVGFMLRREYWRHGYVSEAMNTIIPYLWQVTTHLHLTADADPNNAASCGLLENLGFTVSHTAKNTFCINGVWSDSVYYKLYRPS